MHFKCSQQRNESLYIAKTNYETGFRNWKFFPVNQYQTLQHSTAICDRKFFPLNQYQALQHSTANCERKFFPLNQYQAQQHSTANCDRTFFPVNQYQVLQHSTAICVQNATCTHTCTEGNSPVRSAEYQSKISSNKRELFKTETDMET